MAPYSLYIAVFLTRDLVKVVHYKWNTVPFGIALSGLLIRSAVRVTRLEERTPKYLLIKTCLGDRVYSTGSEGVAIFLPGFHPGGQGEACLVLGWLHGGNGAHYLWGCGREEAF